MTTEKLKQPWELAKEAGKTIICRVLWPMVGVYYPYRKSGDIYVIGADGTNQVAHCQVCDCDFPISEFLEHVNKHNKQRNKYPDFIIDSKLVAPCNRLIALKSASLHVRGEVT